MKANDSDALLLGISLIENVTLEKGEEIAALCSVISTEDAARIIPFLSTVVSELLVESHGLTGAIERLNTWRTGALAGAS